MTESHVVSALVAKRSELSGEIDYHLERIKQIKKDLVGIDRSIKVFSPNYDLRTIKGKRKNRKNSFFKNGSGEGNRMLLDIIRQAHDSITTNEIADEVINRKGFDREAVDMKALKASMFMILKRQQKNEIIKQVDGVDDREKAWVINT